MRRTLLRIQMSDPPRSSTNPHTRLATYIFDVIATESFPFVFNRRFFSFSSLLCVVGVEIIAFFSDGTTRRVHARFEMFEVSFVNGLLFYMHVEDCVIVIFESMDFIRNLQLVYFSSVFVE